MLMIFFMKMDLIFNQKFSYIKQNYVVYKY